MTEEKEEKEEKKNCHMLITSPLNEGGRDKKMTRAAGIPLSFTSTFLDKTTTTFYILLIMKIFKVEKPILKSSINASFG